MNDDHDKILPKSLEYVSPKTGTETPVLIAYKDAIYNDNHSSNENMNEHSEQMVTTSDIKTGQSSVSTDRKIEMVLKQSFVYELGKHVELKLLKDTVFALFAISNFLTSLGFNFPYNFANDLAIDANIIENRRHWIIMSIRVANCFGRIIIRILGDRKWVGILFFFYSQIISVIYLIFRLIV